MSSYNPTKEQQRVLYNYFMTAIYGKDFPTIPEGGRVDFSYEQIKWALKTLHGNHCQVPNCKRQMPYELIVEHINNDSKDYDPANLRLACKSCNQTERQFQPEVQKDTGKPYTKIPSGSESVNPNAESVPVSRKQNIKITESWKNAPPQFKKGERVYETARIRLYIEISKSKDHMYSYEDAINDICALTRCNPETAEKKVRVLTASRLAKFKLTDDSKWIIINENYNAAAANEEDNEIDAEANKLLIEQEKQELAKQKEQIQQELKNHDELKEEHYVALRLLARLNKISFEQVMLNYEKRKAELKSPSIGWLTCLICGQPRPIDKEQLVCTVCESAKSSSGNRNDGSTK